MGKSILLVFIVALVGCNKAKNNTDMADFFQKEGYVYLDSLKRVEERLQQAPLSEMNKRIDSSKQVRSVINYLHQQHQKFSGLKDK